MQFRHVIGWDEFIAFTGEEENFLGQEGDEMVAIPFLVAEEGEGSENGNDTWDQQG